MANALLVLHDASALAFLVVAGLTVRHWLRYRDRSRMFLALAIGSLAALTIVGDAGKLLDSAFAWFVADLSLAVFLFSGLALLFFRDSVMPLRPWVRRAAVLSVASVAILAIVVRLPWGGHAGLLQSLAILAVVLAWCGCVGEPSVRLWLAARRRPAVQQARMRALSAGYLGIIVILLASVLAGSASTSPIMQIVLGLAAIAVVPPLYAGFAPPAWLRRTWRAGEESKFHEATRDLVLYSPDRPALASRALEWAVRLTGADSGFITQPGGVLATQGISPDAAMAVVDALPQPRASGIVPLKGASPRSAIVIRLAAVGRDESMVIVSGPFTPLFGSDEEAWLNHYGALITAAFERVRLVEELAKVNRELEQQVTEVTERTRQLESTNQELEAFTYTVSHDLRAPLRAINGFTSILVEEHAGELSDAARGYLQRVKDNGEHMGRLIDDLLTFSRLGRKSLRTQPVPAREVVESAIASLASSLEGRKVDLVIGELPVCLTDRTLLEEVFANLLGNALKYTRTRDVARVEVGCRPEGGTSDDIVFYVKDNGIGFDMQYSNKLFGVFQRLHRSQDYEGTGVGLAIVKRIVERHGGRVWAEAEVNQGATFYFSLRGGTTRWQPMAA